MIHKRQKDSRGFGTVEIMVVAAIIGITFASLYQLFIVASRPIRASARETEATYLAEEGIEATRILRNNGWTSNIAPLSTATTYYPTLSGGTWTLSSTDPGPINGAYTRTVVLDEAYRDANDDITTVTGTLDPDTKKITSTVSWSERGTSKNVVIETYITNFFAN